MRKKRGFTIVELLVAVIIICILCAAGWVAYSNTIWKAKRTEALSNVAAIRVAENMHRMNTGAFVPAGNVTEINDALGLNLEAKYYTYRVINVTAENFIVVAELIASDVINDLLLFVSMAVVSDSYGFILEDNEQYLDNTGAGTNGYGDGSGNGGIGGGGSAGGGSTGGGSTGGGGSIPRIGIDSGFTGGNIVIGSDGSITSDGTSGGGTGGGGIVISGGTTPTSPTPPIYDTDLTTAINLLSGLTFNDVNAYQLIQDYNIGYTYADFSTFPDGFVGNSVAFWPGFYSYTVTGGGKSASIVGNTIYVNSDLRTGSPASAVAATIAHEATHADYDYNTQQWINRTLAEHPELTASDLHISGKSINEEYNAFSTAVQVWNDIKSSDSDENLDYWSGAYAQGEDYMKGEIRTAYSDDHLYEF